MENSVLLTPNDEKELLDRFLNNPDLRRLRVSFNRFWPNPIWWCAVRKNAAGSRLISHPRSAEIWMDPRITGLHCRGELMGKMRAHPKELTGFHVECRLHGLMTYCIPLVVNQRRIGVLAMSHLKPVSLRRAPLEMLNSHVRLLLEGIRKEMELKRVSDSVRPRAIALSTVHTVHRIINSTLNLDELVTRLANLTAQVLRAKTCTIFLYAAKPIKGLVEKASSGAAVSRRKPRRVLRPGEGMEGRVYTTARYVFRRNTLCVPLIDEDVMGVITLRDKKEDGKFDRFDLEILTTLAEEAVVAIKNALLYEEQKKVTLGAIQSLAAILGARFADSRKLSPAALLKITLAVADVLQLSEEEKQAIHYATLLKDAGKIGLPDEIFRKPTKLTGEEYRLVKQHPIKGAMIVQSFESLKPVAPIILYSHEHFDGTGYPQGIKGNAIPIGARILCVVNAFEALVAGRPYKTRATIKEALEELKRHKGSQFDPRVVDAFEAVISRPVLAKYLTGI